MSDVISIVIVFVFIMIPGILGDQIYRIRAGTSWKEKEWQGLLRLLAFSTFGLILYTLFSSIINNLYLWLMPYRFLSKCNQQCILLPQSFLFFINTSTATTIKPLAFSIAYLGHFIASGLVGWYAVSARRQLVLKAKISLHPFAWDDFVRVLTVRQSNGMITGRSVNVYCTDGRQFIGRLIYAELNAPHNERDIILFHPQMAYPGGIYINMNAECIYIRGSDILWVAVRKPKNPT